jgi:hypothetical protein
MLVADEYSAAAGGPGCDFDRPPAGGSGQKKAPRATPAGPIEPQAEVGHYPTISGLIMSCSSCSRMWQCQTYSLPPVRGLAGGMPPVIGS